MENLSFVWLFLKCLRKYACFKGRVQKKNFGGFCCSIIYLYSFFGSY